MKKLLCIGLFVIGVNTWAGGPLKLRPLNMTVFNHNISTAVTQQSFAQLLGSTQLTALSSAQQTLLLTHKFIEESHVWPRSVIMENGQLTPLEKYTPAQRLETSLGKQIKSALRDPHTPPEIHQELRRLQYDFSPKYRAMQLVDQLNDWITVHDNWPRETIQHEGPLTKDEQYETELAKYANRITKGISSIPSDLANQIRYIRAYYDPSYIPQTEIEKEYQRRQFEWDTHTVSPLYDAYSLEATERQKNFYDAPSLPINPTTSRQMVVASPEANKSYNAGPYIQSTDPDHIYEVLIKLSSWMNTYHSWPKLTTTSAEEIELAQEISQIRASELANRELNNLYQEHMDTSWAPTTPEEIQDMLLELQLWISQYKTWPRTLIPTQQNYRQWKEESALHKYDISNDLPETYDEEQRKELSLGRRIFEFIRHADPEHQNAWRTEPLDNYGVIREIDWRTSRFANPDLELLRKLYKKTPHQYNNRNYQK